MPTYIHLVRHAQGFHNLSQANHAIHDPQLTDLGIEQCKRLCASFPFHEQITHLVASPMRRTIRTCLLSFAPVAARPGMKVILLPEVQEVSNLPCDTGSPREVLAEEFGDAVDLSLLSSENWPDKSRDTPFAPVMDKLEARAQKARSWLRELGAKYERENPGKDAHIVVVTHGGFLHLLTQDWDGMNPERGTGWSNTEWRAYQFKGEADEEARLVETRDSRRQRRGSEQPLTETEQMELRMAMAKGLAEEFGVDGDGQSAN